MAELPGQQQFSPWHQFYGGRGPTPNTLDGMPVYAPDATLLGVMLVDNTEPIVLLLGGYNLPVETGRVV